ncbi:MAG: SIS domain-containing protein [bacterium]
MSVVLDYLGEVGDLLKCIPDSEINKVVDLLYDAFKNDKRLLMFGNGGSGATASHFANDFQKGLYLYGGKPFKALSLADNLPIIMAWGNDTEYANIFEPQVITWAEPGDVVLGISGSGNSENVIRAINRAKSIGAHTVGLSGMGGGKLASSTDFCITVNSDNMQKIEDVHSVLLHCLYSVLRDRLAEELKKG